MKKLRIIFIFVLIIAPVAGISQSVTNGIFHPQSLNGSIKLNGLYREQKSLIGSVEEDQRSTYFIGGIMLNSINYLWAPDIITFDINAEFNPESRNETYLLVPDRSEVRTLNRLGVKTTVFRNKALSVNAYANLNQTYYNRELLSNIKSDNRQIGGLLSLNNKFLPVSLSYRKSDWIQKELQTGRIFSMKQENLMGRLSKSFAKNDSHELMASRDDYSYIYATDQAINNLIYNFSLSDNIYFDRNRKYNYNSYISYYDQSGDNAFDKMEVMERVILNPFPKLRINAGYNYYKLTSPSQVLSQNRVSGSVNHQLFESLTTNVMADYSGISHTIYNENNLKAGLGFTYTKKVPAGRITLSYTYFRTYFDMAGASAPLSVINEEHMISDGIITLLNKPYIDVNSLLIKDQTGVIIYQLNFDYVVIARNNFLEIQRVPGGQITNNQVINADYTAVQPGSYSFEADNNSYSASLLLFKKLFEVYYRGSSQDYRNLSATDFLTLNYYDQNIYGGRFDFGFAGLGAEYDSYNSNIIPYRRYRYYVDVNFSLRSRLLFSLNGNILDYRLLDDDVNQQHSNINGRITFIITGKTKMNLQGGYLSQVGKNIDLDLITARLEILTSLRQLYLRGGLEAYKRHYLKSDFTFTGTFIELVRKF